MTWANFIRQYEATGREKGDGYSSFHFEGMGAEEIARARAMLEERAAAGDTVDMDGLRLVGDAHSAAVLEAAEPLDAQGIRFETTRRETLWALTGDARHLLPLLERTDDRDREVANVAAQLLSRLALPGSFAGPLATRIGDGRHESILLPLVNAWLCAHGVRAGDPTVFQQVLPFSRAVRSAPPAGRAALLAGWERQAR